MNEIKIRKAIITGSTGGPGQALVRKLISEGIEVLLLIRKTSGRAKYLPQSDLIHIVDCDLQQMKDFTPIDTDYDVFFHLGWDYTHPTYRVDPLYQQINITNTLDAVKLAKRAGCLKFIGCGSQAEYGRAKDVLTPDTPCRPEIAYGVAKLCANQMSKLLCIREGIQFNWLRVMSVFGPVDSPGNVVSSTILGVLSGKELKYTKGEQIWDLMYTGDLANAFVAVAKKGIDGEVYTVGSGIKRTLREEIETIVHQLDSKYKIQFGAIPYSENQIKMLMADNTNISKDTGWTPQFEFEWSIKYTASFWKKIYSLYGDNIEEEYFKSGKRICWENMKGIDEYENL